MAASFVNIDRNSPMLLPPDHDTICKLRRENKAAIGAAFIDILELARSLGLLKLGKVSTDGTHIKANASRPSAPATGNSTGTKKTAPLYKLETDVAERTNLLKQSPEVAKRLIGLMTTFEKDIAQYSRPAGFVKKVVPFSK